MYISDGDDDDEDREISFVGSSNLTKYKRYAVSPTSALHRGHLSDDSRPVPIYLDDDDDDDDVVDNHNDIRGTSPESDTCKLRDVMDLFSSDPIMEQSTPQAIPIRVDRKGKGKAVPIILNTHTSAGPRGLARGTSTDCDGIDDLEDVLEPMSIKTTYEGKQVGKRKSEDSTSAPKRTKKTIEPEVSLIARDEV